MLDDVRANAVGCIVVGWAFAPWRPAALLAAQFLSGVCMSASKATWTPGSPPASPPPKA